MTDRALLAILLTLTLIVGIAPSVAAEGDAPTEDGGEDGPLPCFELNPWTTPPSLRQVPCE